MKNNRKKFSTLYGFAINPVPVTRKEHTMNHEEHQAMLREHAEKKIARREAHRKHLHRIKVIPIQLV